METLQVVGCPPGLGASRFELYTLCTALVDVYNFTPHGVLQEDAAGNWVNSAGVITV